MHDLVRIRNGEVCYWPNLGYGRFGAKVTMDNSPRFDSPDLYRPAADPPRRCRRQRPDRHPLPRPDGARLYLNRSGNALSDARALPFPVAD